MGCSDGAAALACLRALPIDDLLNYLVEYPLEHSFPPGSYYATAAMIASSHCRHAPAAAAARHAMDADHRRQRHWHAGPAAEPGSEGLWRRGSTMMAERVQGSSIGCRW